MLSGSSVGDYSGGYSYAGICYFRVLLLLVLWGLCHALQRLFLSSGQQLCGYLCFGIWELPGSWGAAIGLSLYCIIIVSNADNVIRSFLVKRMADTHPLITIFGVVIGLSLFGFMGVIFGPLLLAIFALCVQIFKEEYLDEG